MKNHLHFLTLELTKNCNYSCNHCFQNHEKNDTELSLEEIKKISKEAAYKLGCYHISVTGGEPLMRSDFFDILYTLRESTYSITVMTNGSLLNEDSIKELKHINITNIEVSLLAFNEKNYKSITGRKNQFNNIVNNIKSLRKHKIHVILKYPVQKFNYTDSLKIINFAQEYDCHLVMNPQIMPAQNSGNAPYKFKLKDKELKAIYSLLIKKNLIHKKSFGALLCNIGYAYAYITSSGDIYPCVNYPVILGNIRKDSLVSIWGKRKNWEEKCRFNIQDLKECIDCQYKDYCIRCGGRAYIENNNFIGFSNESCRHSKILYEIFSEYKNKT